MAAANDKVMSELKDITECCICSETFIDARVLPCIHSFCLRCLQKTGSQTNKKPGDNMPCPLCRREFTIPTQGWMDIQKNFFIERLIEVTKTSKLDDNNGSILCDICKSADGEDTAAEKLPSATMYCIVCRDNLCNLCTGEHRKNRASKNHRVVPIGSEVIEELRVDRNEIEACGEHLTKQRDIFCFDCKMIVCILCLSKSHESHKWREVNETVLEFKKQINYDVDKVADYFNKGSKKKERLEMKRMDFLRQVEDVDRELIEVKRLFDEHTNSLLNELTGIKEKRMKEMENEKEEIDRHLVIMDSFKMYCNQLKCKGSHGDICRTVNDLHMRADELKQLHESQMQTELPSFEVHLQKTQLFEKTPSNVENVVGKIREQVRVSTMTSNDAEKMGDEADCVKENGKQESADSAANCGEIGRTTAQGDRGSTDVDDDEHFEDCKDVIVATPTTYDDMKSTAEFVMSPCTSPEESLLL